MLTVTVHQIDQTTITGAVNRFSPENPVVLMPGAHGLKKPVIIPPEKVVFIAFHRDAPPPDACPAPEQCSAYDVHLQGDRIVTVLCDPGQVGGVLGFFALANNDEGLYSAYWFYQQAVVALVDRQQIGTLLVRAGELETPDLERGLHEQQVIRATPLGHILREQEVVASEDIERAVKEQEVQQRSNRRLLLGEILLEAGLVTEEQVQEALKEQEKRRGKRLGQVLVGMGFVSELALGRVLAHKFNLPFVDLDKITVDPQAAAQVPRSLCLKYDMLPFSYENSVLQVALADPLAYEGVDMLRFSTGLVIKPVVVEPGKLDRLLRPYVPASTEVQVDDLDDLFSLLKRQDVKEQQADEDTCAPSDEDGAVVRLINHIIVDAVHRGASDIHVEPNGRDREIQVRLRVDGQCHTAWRLPPSFRAQVAARLKVMARLDIAEHRRPQDGKITLRFKGRKIELRVATLPVVTGDEDVVLRILASGKPIPMNDMALSDRNFAALMHIIHQPHGLVLVVGPTGSGKTTMLHSLLAQINTENRKIWTAEDPVEITQAGLRQVQMNNRAGLTFAKAMRAFLRADPDVIMVGEMRDKETMGIGIEASLTGHLVFSTLHTNSAPETVTRLIDMGMDPFMFSDALQGVLAQRLARRMCQHCRQPYDLTGDQLAQMRKDFGDEELEQFLDGQTPRLWTASGCPRCQGRGYKGRIAVHELLVADESVKRAIQRQEPVEEIRRLAMQGGMRTLLQDGIAKALRGLTDAREILANCHR